MYINHIAPYDQFLIFTKNYGFKVIYIYIYIVYAHFCSYLIISHTNRHVFIYTYVVFIVKSSLNPNA